MILTVTANPAIDRNVTTDRLVFEDRAYILTQSEFAGGRGINASSVIHSFGGSTVAIATVGGRNGKRFEELLSSAAFPVELVRIRNPMRINLTISDQQGLTIKLNEPGPAISAAELARLEEAVRNRLGEAEWLMLCGSLPPGTPPEFYGRLIRAAKERNVGTLLDTDGDALLHGLSEGPSVVTPNQAEAERLLNRALIARSHSIETVTRIRAMGAESVILSLGARGAVGAWGDRMIEVAPPRVEAVCPIGAGDAMAAAFVWAMARKEGFSEALRWGVAAGTASAMRPGLEFASLGQTEEMRRLVEVHEAAP